MLGDDPGISVNNNAWLIASTDKLYSFLSIPTKTTNDNVIVQGL